MRLIHFRMRGRKNTGYHTRSPEFFVIRKVPRNREEDENSPGDFSTENPRPGPAGCRNTSFLRDKYPENGGQMILISACYARIGRSGTASWPGKSANIRKPAEERQRERTGDCGEGAGRGPGSCAGWLLSAMAYFPVTRWFRQVPVPVPKQSG